jgi:hypothetical protein
MKIATIKTTINLQERQQHQQQGQQHPQQGQHQHQQRQQYIHRHPFSHIIFRDSIFLLRYMY